MAMGLFPYASQSLFLYDRQFYQGENGARLYPPSAYYMANLTLELLLNAANGCIYALITYYMLDYQAYVQAPNAALSAFGFIGLVTLTNVVSNVRVRRGCGWFGWGPRSLAPWTYTHQYQHQRTYFPIPPPTNTTYPPDRSIQMKTGASPLLLPGLAQLRDRLHFLLGAHGALRPPRRLRRLLPGRLPVGAAVHFPPQILVHSPAPPAVQKQPQNGHPVRHRGRGDAGHGADEPGDGVGQRVGHARHLLPLQRGGFLLPQISL